jgi:integrase/recombinase XerD
VAKWRAEADLSHRPSTVARYKASLRNVRSHLDDLYIDQIDRKTIAKIAGRTGISNATRRRDITAVSAVLRYCVSQAWRDDNPAREWDRSAIKEKRDPIVLPDPEDIDAVVSLAPGNFALMIRFAQYTGMRQEEIAGMERGQIRHKEQEVDLWNSKTNRPRTLELDDRAWGTVCVTPTHMTSRWFFWHHDGKRYLNVASRFAAIMRRAEEKGKVGRGFRFHDLRHWYAVDYLRRGAGTIYDLQKALGHKSITTTEIYLDYLTAEQQRQVKYGVSQNVSQG